VKAGKRGIGRAVVMAAAILALGMAGCVYEEGVNENVTITCSRYYDIVNSAGEAWVTCDNGFMFNSPKGYCFGLMFLKRDPNNSDDESPWGESYDNVFQLIFGGDGIGWYAAESERGYWTVTRYSEEEEKISIEQYSGNTIFFDYVTVPKDAVSDNAMVLKRVTTITRSWKQLLSGDKTETDVKTETMIFTRKPGIKIEPGYPPGFYKSREDAKLPELLISKWE
jgi:hypothetical protein